MYSSSLIVLLICGCLSVVHSKIVQYESCSDDPGTCVINEIRVTPCAREPCAIPRGKTATLEFDFTSANGADSAESSAFWVTTSDLPFVGMDRDACKYVPCPIEANTKQTYTYGLKVPSKVQKQTYDVKWKLAGGDLNCCFIIKIRMV